MLAVSSGSVELVAMFVEGGANINEQDKVSLVKSNDIIT